MSELFDDVPYYLDSMKYLFDESVKIKRTGVNRSVVTALEQHGCSIDARYFTTYSSYAGLTEAQESIGKTILDFLKRIWEAICSFFGVKMTAKISKYNKAAETKPKDVNFTKDLAGDVLAYLGDGTLPENDEEYKAIIRKVAKLYTDKWFFAVNGRSIHLAKVFTTIHLKTADIINHYTKLVADAIKDESKFEELNRSLATQYTEVIEQLDTLKQYKILSKYKEFNVDVNVLHAVTLAFKSNSTVISSNITYDKLKAAHRELRQSFDLGLAHLTKYDNLVQADSMEKLKDTILTYSKKTENKAAKDFTTVFYQVISLHRFCINNLESVMALAMDVAEIMADIEKYVKHKSQ